VDISTQNTNQVDLESPLQLAQAETIHRQSEGRSPLSQVAKAQLDEETSTKNLNAPELSMQV